MKQEEDNNTQSKSNLPFLRQFTRKAATDDAASCAAPRSGPSISICSILCSGKFFAPCEACAVLFCGQQGAHFLRVPRRVRALVDFQMADLQWEALMIPINLAFFYRDTAAGKMMAMYPSPAGAIESLLSMEA